MKIKCKIGKVFGAVAVAISTFISNAIAVSTGRFIGTLYGVTEPEPVPKNSIVDVLIQIGSIIIIPIILIIGIIVFIKKKKNKD